MTVTITCEHETLFTLMLPDRAIQFTDLSKAIRFAVYSGAAKVDVVAKQP